MITEEQLIAYVSGRLNGTEREQFEAQLAKDPEALRLLVEQEKMDTALSMMLAQPDRVPVKESIMAVIEGPAETEVKSKIYEQVEYETKRKKLATGRASGGGIWSWFRGLPIPLQITGFAALALGFYYLGKPTGNDRLVQMNPSPTTNSFQPPVKLPDKQPRDPVNWPFAANSPWNTPIGSEAKYVDPVGINLAAGITLYDAGQVHPTVRASAAPGASLIRLYRQNESDPIASLRLEPDDLPTTTRDFALIAENGKTIYDITGAQLNGTNIIANNVVVADLTGSGMPAEYNAPTSTGFSDYAGSLCADDFKGPIRRALGAVFHPSVLAAKPNGSAHTWPATKTPGNYEARFGPLRQDGNLHIGTLMAIPQNVDLATIGIGTSGPAYELARAFQNYGLYLKKPLPGRTDGPLLGMCGDLRTANLPPDFGQQLARIASYLKVVENNGPNSIGGGGTPAQPTAPEFNQ